MYAHCQGTYLYIISRILFGTPRKSKKQYCDVMNNRLLVYTYIRTELRLYIRGLVKDEYRVYIVGEVIVYIIYIYIIHVYIIILIFYNETIERNDGGAIPEC